MERKSKFDYIIIETSGMADPGTSLRFPKRTGIGACIWEIYLYNQKHPYTGPVASCLWVDEELESQLYLDGIVTVVDAKHISRHIGKAHGSSTGGAFGWMDGWPRAPCLAPAGVDRSPRVPTITARPPT